MPENQKVTGFERAFGDARSQAGKVANEVTGAAQGSMTRRVTVPLRLQIPARRRQNDRRLV